MAHFPNSGGNKIFLENPTLSCTTSYGFLAPCQNFKKLMIQFQENGQTARRTNRRTDRAYFIGPFQLLLGVQKGWIFFSNNEFAIGGKTSMCSFIKWVNTVSTALSSLNIFKQMKDFLVYFLSSLFPLGPNYGPMWL